MKDKFFPRKNAQPSSCPNRANLAVVLPHLDGPGRLFATVQIPVGNMRQAIEDLPVDGRAQQLDVFGVRPKQGNCRASRATEKHALGRKVRQIPELLGKKTHAMGEIFHRIEIGPRVSSGCQFIMPAFASQERPQTTTSPALEGRAVGLLTVPVVIVSVPAGAEWRIDF